LNFPCGFSFLRHPDNRGLGTLLTGCFQRDSFLAALGFELRASHLPWVQTPVLGRRLSHSTPAHFLWFFFKIGSWELFAQAGFESQFSWSLPLE
jgi:hypothetical protein